MELLDDLRNRCNNLILNSNNKDKYLLIRKLIESNDCFFKLDRSIAFSILIDLGILEDNLEEYYNKLTSYSMFRI